MQPNNDPTDSLLVSSLSKGDLIAFNNLYKKYCGPLYRFAYGYFKTEEEAEDLLQEVFTIIWEKRAELKKDLSFKSFLFTIALNIIRKRFRSRAYLSEYFKAETRADLDTQTSQTIISNSLYQYLTELVKILPKRRKEIFIKSRFDGLSNKEIAEELKISHKTVENHLTEASKFIRPILNRERIS
jgi:RNA polymerase sigma-70 factor (family 1)